MRTTHQKHALLPAWLAACVLAVQLVSAWHSHLEGWSTVPSVVSAEQQHCLLCHVPIALTEPPCDSTGIVLAHGLDSVIPPSQQFVPHAHHSPNPPRAPPTAL